MSHPPPSRRTVLGQAAAGVASASAPKALGAPALRPNIVFIVADDLGHADLSCYGRRDYRTRHIDTLARDGLKFTTAYSNAPLCSQTRVALMTGRWQDRLEVGVRGAGGAIGLAPSHPTLPSLLRAAGYGTTLVGKWHLGALPAYGPLKSGYDQFFGVMGGYADYFTHKDENPNTPDGLVEQEVTVERQGYMTDLLAERAVRIVEAYARERRPFFLSLHFTAPHWPWEGPDDEAESRRITNQMHYDGGDQATYRAMMMSLDQNVGRVLAALDRLRLARDTIVVFTSDNGGERFSDNWPFRGRKTDLLEGGLRVPALVRWPARVRKGAVTDQAMITMDWLPTLLAAAGTAPDPAYPPDGENLLPVMTGAAPTARSLFWRYTNIAQGVQTAARSGALKYYRVQDREYLFDVSADPLENANLKDRRPEAFAELKARYQAWAGTMHPEPART